MGTRGKISSLISTAAVSSIVNEVIKTNSKFFEEEILVGKNKRYTFVLSYEAFVRKKLLLLLFNIRLFLFYYLVFTCFLRCKIFFSKNEFVLIASFTILLTCPSPPSPPLNPPMENYFSLI